MGNLARHPGQCLHQASPNPSRVQGFLQLPRWRVLSPGSPSQPAHRSALRRADGCRGPTMPEWWRSTGRMAPRRRRRRVTGSPFSTTSATTPSSRSASEDAARSSTISNGMSKPTWLWGGRCTTPPWPPGASRAGTTMSGPSRPSAGWRTAGRAATRTSQAMIRRASR